MKFYQFCCEEQVFEATPPGRLRCVGSRLLFQLHATRTTSEQFPCTQRCRKVVLATNIAETSITIPGIRYVVDTPLSPSGLSDILMLSSICHLLWFLTIGGGELGKDTGIMKLKMCHPQTGIEMLRSEYE